jgi:hypothetical protein
MRHSFSIVITGFVAAAALSTVVAAQNPQGQPQRTPATPDQPSAQAAQSVTVEGCVMREADVPGRKPSLPEQAGISEDFILTSSKVVKGSAPALAKPGDKPVGTAGSQAMFKIQGVDRDKLKELAGRRVQIEGTFEHLERAKPGAATTSDDLVEIRGTTIRQATGDCPAK